jgi:PKD repeat protein
MRSYILFLFALVIGIHAIAGKKLKVLFIGDSYTYVNNLPQITADIAASMGDTLIFDSYALGGHGFWQYYVDPLCASKIRSAQWDYVILQEQSQQPSQPTGDFLSTSYLPAAVLDTMIESNDSCTKTMFYMTWGYENGDSIRCVYYPAWPAICTYEGMDSLTRLRYMAYADTSWLSVFGHITGSNLIRNSQVSPVGAVRHYLRHNYPAIELYQADGSHPTEAASYAGACTFYVALFHKDPVLIPYNYTLSDTDASDIRTVTRIVAYDSMSYWHIGEYDLRAQFSYVVGVGNTIAFTNESANASAYIWDFGDGNTATATSPSHTYTTGGIYMVKLIAVNAACNDTSYMAISTNPTKIENINNLQDFITAPNPINEKFTISSTGFLSGIYQIRLYNSIGQLVYSHESLPNIDQVIDVAALNTGLYLISIVNNGAIIYQNKIIK